MSKKTARTADGVKLFVTDLPGPDGRPRLTTLDGKKAEQYFLNRARIAQERADQEMVVARETDLQAYKQRLEVARTRAAQQEIERDRSFKKKLAEEKQWRQIQQEEAAGVVMVRVYEDLGPVWTPRWLADYIVPYVPQMAFADINIHLTCKALLRGLEIYRDRRRQRKTVTDAAAFIVQAASAWQTSKPSYRVPLAEALQNPERIASSR